MSPPDIPTPIPESVVDNFRTLVSGGVLDAVWKLFVGGVFIGLVYLLVAAGTVGAIVAGILMGTLINDEVRALVVDVWRREFWVWRT